VLPDGTRYLFRVGSVSNVMAKVRAGLCNKAELFIHSVCLPESFFLRSIYIACSVDVIRKCGRLNGC
jgi:hypothetical protein